MKLHFVLILVALAALQACTPRPPSQDAAFVALADNYLEWLLAHYPESATLLGDHRRDGELNDYTATAVSEGLASNKRYLRELETIDPSRLSDENAVDYEIFKNQILFQIWSAEELREHEWNPMRYNIGDAIYGLLARDYAPLEERLRSLHLRLQRVSSVFDAARSNLANPPKVHTETAILQNDGAISLLREGLDELLVQAPEAAQELSAVREAAAQELETYGQWLRDDLLPRADGEFRIGQERFRKKLAFTLHSDLSMEEVLERAQKRLEDLQTELYTTALPLFRELNPKAGKNPVPDRSTVIRSVLDSLADSHPTDRTIVDDAKKSLAAVTGFVLDKNLVTVPDEPLQIIVMPEFRRGVSTAYCDSPGPLERHGETFYAISPTPSDWTSQRKLSFYREYNDYMLQDLTVHEAIPGHFLQIAHSNRLQAPTKIRSIFSSGTFVEGWALYAEQIMAEHGYGGPSFKMQQLKMLTRAVINAILDQQIHAGSMSEQEAIAMMMQKGFQEDGEAAGKWKRAQLTSAQLSTYFVGITEHNDLRRAWVDRHGPIADWRAYHDMVLSHGSPPTKFVRHLLGL